MPATIAPNPRRRIRRIATNTALILGVWALWAALTTFLVQPFAIPSASMESTEHIGDRVLVDKTSSGSAQRGDVIVFREPDSWHEAGEPEPSTINTVLSHLGLSAGGTNFTKRVIGVGGDTVSCSSVTGKVSVNGVPITEPYVNHGMAPCASSCPMQTFSVKVPANHVWVMGDNRNNSADARCFVNGSVPDAKIVGRVVGVAWPLIRWGQHLSDRGAFAFIPHSSHSLDYGH